MEAVIETTNQIVVQKDQKPISKKDKPDPYIELANKILARAINLERSDKVALKRTYGLTIQNLKPADKLLFYSIFPSNMTVPKDQYLFNCILFGVQTLCLQDSLGTEGSVIQNLIADDYRDGTNSTRCRIEAFMSSDGRSNIMFFKDLGYIASRYQKCRKINVFDLTKDLIKWDFGGRDKWLDAVIKIRQDDRQEDNVGLSDTSNDNINNTN